MPVRSRGYFCENSAANFSGVKLNVLKSYWRELLRSVLSSFGVLFLLVESYEVVTDYNATFNYGLFLFCGIVPGLGFFLLDGFRLSGFLKSEVKVPIAGSDTKVLVKFGDIFTERGWKAVGVNDFFDSRVDEDLVSSNSLHGHVLMTYWGESREDWVRQVNKTIKAAPLETVVRSKGNKSRYPVGTTARACTNQQNFLFVALTKTNVADNISRGNAELLISAVRGLLVEARAACSMEPLSLPLMGSALGRIGVKKSMLVDLIITAVQEESQNGRITREINIVLPAEMKGEVNLKNYVRNWSDGV